MNKIVLGGDFTNWIQPTTSVQNRTRTHTLLGANTNFDAQATRHPHTRSQDLTTIATRTTNAAVLVDIANNESDDAGALTVVVNNVYHNVLSGGTL